MSLIVSNLGGTWYDFVKEDEVDETECSEFQGTWFDGYVGGFQFELLGVTVDDATAPDGFTVSTSPTTVLGFSLSGATIPVGEGILTQVSFTSFNGEGICFGEDTGSSGGTAIAAGSGDYIAADWGACFCSDNSPADACGECGGAAVYNTFSGLYDIDDGLGSIYCDCESNIYDECDECGGSGASEECWDYDYTLTKVCDETECTADPNAFGYNVYRANPQGGFSQIASNLSYTNYLDAPLGYSESHIYKVSYLYDINQNGSIEFDTCIFGNELSTDEAECIESGGYWGEESPLSDASSSVSTAAEFLGCTYPSAS